jgi:hypothetical protein
MVFQKWQRLIYSIYLKINWPKLKSAKKASQLAKYPMLLFLLKNPAELKLELRGD